LVLVALKSRLPLTLPIRSDGNEAWGLKA